MDEPKFEFEKPPLECISAITPLLDYLEAKLVFDANTAAASRPDITAPGIEIELAVLKAAELAGRRQAIEAIRKALS